MSTSPAEAVAAPNSHRATLVASPGEMLAVGRALGAAARAGDVVLLEGPLGAGKTLLVRGLAFGLGAAGAVMSPTFVLVRLHDDGRLPLVHADLYRLGNRQEVDALGLLELSADGVLAVEWAERAPWLHAPDRLRLRLQPAGAEATREVEVLEGPQHLVAALLQDLPR